MRNFYVFVSFVICISGLTNPAYAKGCIKGAIVGGAAGHYAGHHGVIGAAVGCAVGHHEAQKNEPQIDSKPKQ